MNEKRSSQAGTVSIILTSLSFSILANLFSDYIERFIDLFLPYEISSTLLTFIFTTAAATASIIFYYRASISNLPIAHNVAIVGFPRSGKTTLIISLFAEIFARRMLGIRATLTTVSTIERVNELLKKLEKGQALGPTTDQDLFAYRTNVRMRGLLFNRTYKVEFGDFPGEDSEEYVKNYGEWLHTTPFFKWTSSADAIVFVIDLAKYLDPITRHDYIADISASIRAAWQHLLEHAEEGSEGARNRSVVLAFTKADLFGFINTDDIPDLEDIELQQAIVHLGFGESVPKLREMDMKALQTGEEIVRHDFADLLEYFRGETTYFTVVFISAFATKRGVRLGSNELLSAVLPKRRLSL